MKKLTQGMTIIELLVTIVIIAILAIIAVILYTAQIRNSRRTDAINSVYSIALAEESYRTTNSSYGSLSQINGSSTSSSGYYTISVTSVSATTYTITATATGDQVNDEEGSTSCSTLTYAMSTGAVTKTPSACWPS